MKLECLIVLDGGRVLIITAPTATGKKTKLILWPVNITIIGFAPAGGCTVLVIIITKTAKATPKPNEINVLPRR